MSKPWPLALFLVAGCASAPAAGPSGPPGPPGPKGPQGEPGPAGAAARPIQKGDVQHLSSRATAKPDETPTAFVVCASEKDVLLFGACLVHGDGDYDLVEDKGTNLHDATKAAGWSCRLHFGKNARNAAVTAVAACLRAP